jgi:hypothetical protein
MGIGASVFLIAVGLILALAVDVNVAGLDIQLIGWILAIAGVIGLVTSFALFGPRRRRTTTVVDQSARVEPGAYHPQQRRTVQERTYDEGPL